MARIKLELLSNVLQKELGKAEKRMIDNKQVANEIARSAAASPSQSGDREHSQNQAMLSQEVYIKTKEMAEKVNIALSQAVPDRVSGIVHVEIKYENSDFSQELYLVDYPLNIPGVNLISRHSPLGNSLLDKKTGDVFEYEIEGIGIKRGVVTDIN